MSNIGTKRRKKIWRLLVVCCTFAILLSASTYAWFVGMKTVGVNTFDIDIATTEGLFLSMDGQSWSYSISPTDEDTPVYVNNANTFAPEGLIPMSSVGDMDVTSSRMKLYEKASLSAVPGGYKFLANQVNNYTTDNGHGEFIEGKGYVAFDLFIRNLSGNEYYEENNPLNEEAIYLLPESSVKVSLNGVENTGIENSVRVGFVQLGRVKSCLIRNAGGLAVNDPASYATGSTCQAILPDDDTGLYSSLPTYAVSRNLAVTDNVNIYDGASYNSYTANTIDYDTYINAPSDTKQNYKLVDFPYFTDTMKNIAGADRPEFMTLAPNSITKVRVYVWIEGQDIDNYDFAQLGKEISIQFGFTKQRYYGEDVDYDGNPELPEEVVKMMNVAYTNTGSVSSDDPQVTFDSAADQFSVPKWYDTFTFTDGGTKKVATLNEDGINWTFANEQ